MAWKLINIAALKKHAVIMCVKVNDLYWVWIHIVNHSWRLDYIRLISLSLRLAFFMQQIIEKILYQHV